MAIKWEKQDAILKVLVGSWTPACDVTRRSGAACGSLTSPGCWTCRPGRPGMRVIIRKERPRPGAQLRFTDIDR
jgi:hypothetical protein